MLLNVSVIRQIITWKKNEFFFLSVCAVLKVQLCPALGPQARIVPPNLS